jgi:hypothetical protein
MNWRFRIEASQIATRFDWSRFPNIVDVGGGDSPLFLEILHAHPGVTGRILDLEPTAAAAGERLAAAGLQHRASATAGSFFDPLCRPGRMLTCSPISCTTGTTNTPAESSPNAAEPPPPMELWSW